VGDNTRHTIILEKVAEGRVKGGKVYQRSSLLTLLITDMLRAGLVCNSARWEMRSNTQYVMEKIAELQWGRLRQSSKGWVEIIIGTLILGLEHKKGSAGLAVTLILTE
jgi:hypothetical protein